MNGEVGGQEKVKDVDDDIVSDEFLEETVVLVDVADDDVGDFSAELDVSQMVAKLEATDGTDIHRKREIHRRLEDIQDQRETERNIDSTFNFNIDEDV
jgi:hypothetical protein